MGVWFWGPERPERYFVVECPEGIQVVEADDLGSEDMDYLVGGPFDRHDAIEARDLLLQEVTV